MAKIMANKIKRIYIEITNICNLSCSFCAKHHRDYKSLSLDEFEHILKQVKNYTNFIYLHVQGEPLSHPHFDEILSLCDSYNMQVQLVTNGTFLNKHFNMINHPSLRKVSISLQSIEYQAIDLNDYMNTIISFIDLCMKNNHPIVEIRFWRNDQYELPKTKTCLDFLKQKYTFTLTERNNHYRISENVYIDFDNMFSWPDLNSSTNEHNGTCLGAKTQIAILSDGSVVPCCLDTDAHVLLGNIFHDDLETILNQPPYRNLVKEFNDHKIQNPFCLRCTYRLRFSKK